MYRGADPRWACAFSFGESHFKRQQSLYKQPSLMFAAGDILF
jgi:hypothetical protein